MKVLGLVFLCIGLVFAQDDLNDVRYLLWTSSNSGDSDYYELGFLDSDSLASSPFDGSKKTYFVYHGWTDNGLNDWIRQGKTDILSIEDSNYISVDWELLADNPLYEGAVENVYLVADRTAQLINWLNDETGLDFSNIHIFGHSLGGHCSGMTGYYLQSYGKGSVARITGLDPAGPLFYSKDSTERIDSSHADFVDIIHTNAATNENAGAGLVPALGHIDFYPNGGSFQPGCGVGGDLVDNLTGCSHGRAPDYFIESIVGSTPFTAQPCSSEEDYTAGLCTSCGSGCVDMGFHLTGSERGVYYLTTNSRSPYAMG